MKEPEMDAIAGFIDRVLQARGDAKVEASVRADVAFLSGRFPLYAEHLA
jgi:glycine/serine hydroxymethyltransferase